MRNPGSIGLAWKLAITRRYSPGLAAVGMPPDCSITPTFGRSFLASRTGSRPSTRTIPSSGRRYPSQISIVVVLPAPFGPRMAVTCARSACRDSPATATVRP